MTDERPSKSARKREALAIRAIADELVALKPGQIATVVDDPDVVRAVHEAQSIAAHGALRRQKQYIAKLLRDEDSAPIRARLDALAGDPVAEKRRFKRAEQLRDALIASPGDADDALVEAGLADTAGIIAALAEWRSAGDDAARRSAARKLFRAIHGQLAALPEPR
jgi:ribosome-associated protein